MTPMTDPYPPCDPACGPEKHVASCSQNQYMTDHTPKTIPEQLDAARTGEEFGAVLLGFMAAVDKEREADK
jgi:hypothetical protein